MWLSEWVILVVNRFASEWELAHQIKEWPREGVREWMSEKMVNEWTYEYEWMRQFKEYTCVLFGNMEGE